MANPIDTRSLSGSKSFQDLAAFDRYHSEAGLRRRYVSGRTRAMGQRLWVGFVGIVILTVLISPQVGFLAAAIHIPAELTEFFIFRRLLARGDFESRSSEWTIRAATGIQAIGMCAPIALCGLHGEGLRVLAWSYFLGATINSILTARHHRSSHMIRMSMLFGAAAIVLLEAYFIAGLGAIDVLTEVTAVGAMIYMLYYLFTHLDRRDMRTVAAERNLLLQSTMAQRLALVAEHATDSVILMDANQHITWVNDQFTQLTGFTLAEVGGRHPGDFLNHPDTDPAEVARIVDAAASQKPVNALLLNRRKDGTTLWMEANQTPVHDSEGHLIAFVSVERDVSEMVQKRRELRTALDQAETADREKTAFLGRMSHELRTPANGIVGGTDLLRETHLDGDQEGVLTILEESSARMMRLIEDILAYSEISDRAVKARAEPVDMAALVAGIFLDYHAETAAQGVKLICELPETGGAIVRSDALLMRRMVDKLVSNAVKFTDKGSVTVRLRFPDPGRLKVIVADTGIGIAPPDMQRIFSRFEQADGAKTRARDGIGLGLSTAQELARLLGGHIQAASDLGLGSTFTIDLKVRRLPGPEARRTLPEKLHVLVAEDNRTNRLLIEKMFKNMPQRLVFANDGLQAVEMYRSEPPDVVLMDISMPNMDGIDATRGIRAHEESDRLPRCPIVAVTANASDDDRQRCFEAGMDGFLAKPLRKTHLMETMGRILT